MSISGIALFILFLVGCAAFALWPVLFGRNAPTNSGKLPGPLADVAALQAEREAILTAVRDLDFDYQTGKFSEEDYLAQRESLMGHGVEILKQIDAIESEAIESAVSARRERISQH